MSYDFDPQEFNEGVQAAKKSLIGLALALQHQSITACENVEAAERFFELVCREPEPPKRTPLPRDKLHGINIVEEYELIKQKKSKLSANMRRLVVRKVESCGY